MGRAKLAALWTPKALTLLKIQLQNQPTGFASNRHSAIFHFASSCKAGASNASGVIRPICSPGRDLQGPAMRLKGKSRQRRTPGGEVLGFRIYLHTMAERWE
jgi:hypothetical protein